MRAIRAEFEAESYAMTLKVSGQKTVHSAFTRFRGLPYEPGLSPRQNEVLTVKIEVVKNAFTVNGWIALNEPGGIVKINLGGLTFGPSRLRRASNPSSQPILV